jgi:hypothetical protein
MHAAAHGVVDKLAWLLVAVTAAACTVSGSRQQAGSGGTCQDAAECVRQFPDIGSCRTVACEGGACVVRPVPDGVSCSAGACDGLLWRPGGACSLGVCALPAAVNCQAGAALPCQQALCAASSGCSVTPRADGSPCDADGSACTAADSCQSGVCTVAQALDCQDGNPCTTDSCDPDSGDCRHLGASGPCDDGSACTQADTCVASVCSGAAVDCGDGDPCTLDTCTVQSGCQHSAIGGCSAGAPPCLSSATPSLACDDGNPCTTDSCDAVAGCLHGATTAACDDGDACTSADSCSGLVCKGTAVLCGDGNPCTDDSCGAASGCVHVANAAACDDGDACTQGEACNGGSCTGGQQTVCDDSNPCTVDSCVSGSGCQSGDGPYGIPCDDGNPCTADGGCDSGSCVQFSDGECNDGQPCTVDKCDTVLGCIHTPKSGCTLCAGKPTCIGSALPSFALLDQNPNSPTWQQPVTPLAWKGKPILMIAVHGY